MRSTHKAKGGAASGGLVGVSLLLLYLREATAEGGHVPLQTVLQVMVLPVLGAGIGALLGLTFRRPGTVYWPYLAAAFALAAWIPYSPPGSGMKERLGAIYLHPGMSHWKQILMVHAGISLVVATLATIVHRLAAKKSTIGPLGQFRLAAIIGTTVLLAVAFGVLRWAQADPMVFVVVLFLGGGRLVCELLVVGLLGHTVAGTQGTQPAPSPAPPVARDGPPADRDQQPSEWNARG